MKAILEGLLFVVGDEGLNINEICEILDVNEEQAKEIIDELTNEYNDKERGIELKFLGNKYKLTTKQEHKEYYKKLSEITDVRNLSQSALETLAIIAYNEPVTRLQVDELRGVNSAQMIRSLVAKDFVKELGKADTLGRPNLYGITSQFLDYFGLSSRDELPKFEEIITNEEQELYSSKYKEENIEQL